MRSSTAGLPFTAMPESIHTKLASISPLDASLITHATYQACRPVITLLGATAHTPDADPHEFQNAIIHHVFIAQAIHGQGMTTSWLGVTMP